jgi:hypothetical protein
MNTERQETASAKYHAILSGYEFKNSYEYTPQPYPIDVLIDSACQAMDVPRHLFTMKTRKREIVYARRLVSVYLRINTNKTLESIAELTGSRDHACINHDRLWHNQCVDVSDPVWLKNERYFLDNLRKFSVNYSVNMRFPKTLN